MSPSDLDLLAELRDPAVFGRPAGARVELLQTHISIVALVGDDAYKFKKHVDLEFLDYTTLAQRLHFCAREVELNRRLAPDVYLGVAELRRGDDGRLRLGGPGELLDVAVHMRRLPDAATLAHRLAADEAGPALLHRIGRRLHDFHRTARRGRDISAYATSAAVAANARQNFAQLADLRPRLPDGPREPLLTRLAAATERALTRHRVEIDRRADHDIACDTHGDLRLDHIYLLPERAPHDLVILDCIEFNDQFRFSDPICDLAFLVMDLHRVARHDLADALLAGYFAADAPPVELAARALLPLYTAYRATVRAKVEAMKAAEPEVPADAAADALLAAHRLLLLALRELQPPALRPCLVLVTGLPGTGKSTLASRLAADGFAWVRSDAVRKQLAHLSEAPDSNIYTPAWTDRTYATCLQHARAALLAGDRVVVDANFKREAQRAPFLALARDLGVPLLLLVCDADPAVVRDRLAKRTGDLSDADIAVYEAARGEWQPPADALVLDTARAPDDLAAAVQSALRARALA
jgi:aminoglycoside phosphotransferase family enzyme/predicted kinase